MTLTRAVLDASINLGLYRPLRAFDRMIRPWQRERLSSHIALYKSLMPRDSLCFDVGANIGEKSEAMLKAGMRVIAFEPNLRVIPELLARCSHYPNWRLITAGVHSQPDLLTFFARRSHGQSGFHQQWETSSVLGESYVPAIPLDYAIKSTTAPAYIKIDVEGWEHEVLKGLSTPIRTLSFEFHLHADQIEATRKCLQRLSEISTAYEVNVTPAEQATFLWPDWRPIAETLDWFPGNLRDVLNRPYGDLFIRLRSAPKRMSERFLSRAAEGDAWALLRIAEDTGNLGNGRTISVRREGDEFRAYADAELIAVSFKD